MPGARSLPKASITITACSRKSIFAAVSASRNSLEKSIAGRIDTNRSGLVPGKSRSARGIPMSGCISGPAAHCSKRFRPNNPQPDKVPACHLISTFWITATFLLRLAGPCRIASCGGKEALFQSAYRTQVSKQRCATRDYLATYRPHLFRVHSEFHGLLHELARVRRNEFRQFELAEDTAREPTPQKTAFECQHRQFAFDTLKCGIEAGKAEGV